MNAPRRESAPFASLPRICVAVTGATPGELLAESRSLIHESPDESPFQELRLDYLQHPGSDLQELQAHLAAHPDATFLATCRRVASGGHFTGTPEEEVAILAGAARDGCAIVDLSLESAEALGSGALAQLRDAGAAVLLSWHDFHGTGELETVLRRMRRFAPDFCKLVPTAGTLADNLPLLQLLERERGADGGALVGLMMGEAGVLSRVLGVRAGSAFTFASSTDTGGTAPGQIAARTLRALYRLDQIGPATRLFGVAGHPIRSSLSPLMLNTAFARTGENAVYVPLLTGDAEELLRVAQALPLAGFSITMPLKQAVLPLLDGVDPLAARIGAVNTAVRTPEGRLIGYNTDAAGITAPLEERLSLPGARVLVLGAGGAARAAVFACSALGAEVSILNRTAATAEALAAQSGTHSVTAEQVRALPPFDVLIQATPAGMRGSTAELPLAPGPLPARLVFDLVYNPLETPLLRAAAAEGIPTICGAEMFVHQGARQFELWTGRPAPVDAMREVVMHELRARARG